MTTLVLGLVLGELALACEELVVLASSLATLLLLLGIATGADSVAVGSDADIDLALGDEGGWYEKVATLAPLCNNSLRTRLLPRATAT